MTMTQSRDFLHDPNLAPKDINLASMLERQNRLLADIALNARKQNPDIICTTVVQGQDPVTGQISDGNPHKIWFEIGGKPVRVYKVLYWTYDNTPDLRLSIEATGSADGMLAPGDYVNGYYGNPVVLPITVENLYIKGNGGHPYRVNWSENPVATTNPVAWIYGFTISNFGLDDLPNY